VEKKQNKVRINFNLLSLDLLGSKPLQEFTFDMMLNLSYTRTIILISNHIMFRFSFRVIVQNLIADVNEDLEVQLPLNY